jgi:hypothetical protein
LIAGDEKNFEEEDHSSSIRWFVYVYRNKAQISNKFNPKARFNEIAYQDWFFVREGYQNRVRWLWRTILTRDWGGERSE